MGSPASSPPPSPPTPTDAPARPDQAGGSVEIVVDAAAIDLTVEEESSSVAVADPSAADAVTCRQCGTAITRQSLAVRPAGSHEHTHRNPAGYSWAIACYRRAFGCDSRGPLRAEASWFDGYSWCYATCAACGRHLGWWFVGAGPSFAGLIVSRLAR